MRYRARKHVMMPQPHCGQNRRKRDGWQCVHLRLSVLIAFFMLNLNHILLILDPSMALSEGKDAPTSPCWVPFKAQAFGPRVSLPYLLGHQVYLSHRETGVKPCSSYSSNCLNE